MYTKFNMINCYKLNCSEMDDTLKFLNYSGISYVTGFWKISPNVTFYSSNIYNQNEERKLPINLKVVTMCSSNLELPENNWKYFETFCNPFAVVTINCVVLCISMWHLDWFSKIGSHIFMHEGNYHAWYCMCVVICG